MLNEADVDACFTEELCNKSDLLNLVQFFLIVG